MRRDRQTTFDRARTGWLLAALTMLVPAYPAAATSTLSTDIDWMDGNGTIQTSHFQGTLDGAALTGFVTAKGTEYRVRGTITSEGAVTGTLLTSGETTAGSFSARLSGDQLLEGAVTLDGSVGAWIAPGEAIENAASKLP